MWTVTYLAREEATTEADTVAIAHLRLEGTERDKTIGIDGDRDHQIITEVADLGARAQDVKWKTTYHYHVAPPEMCRTSKSLCWIR